MYELAVVAECHLAPPMRSLRRYTRWACRGYDARVEHRFSGPSYTLGVEEELMIVDAETLDLSNSIEGLLADLREPGPRARSSRS